MARVTKENIAKAAADRRERIKGYMTQEPPVPFQVICQIEGLEPRGARSLIKSVQDELGIEYGGLGLRMRTDLMPYGLTPSTARLRQRLGDNLYLLLERGNDSGTVARNDISHRVGLNIREQIKAQQRPFNFDWKLSQIERLARELNRLTSLLWRIQMATKAINTLAKRGLEIKAQMAQLENELKGINSKLVAAGEGQTLEFDAGRVTITTSTVSRASGTTELVFDRARFLELDPTNPARQLAMTAGFVKLQDGTISGRSAVVQYSLRSK